MFTANDIEDIFHELTDEIKCGYEISVNDLGKYKFHIAIKGKHLIEETIDFNKALFEVKSRIEYQDYEVILNKNCNTFYFFISQNK